LLFLERLDVCDSRNIWENHTKENSRESRRKDSLTRRGNTPYDNVTSIKVGSGLGML
jgi:hypothetical protein